MTEQKDETFDTSKEGQDEAKETGDAIAEAEEGPDATEKVGEAVEDKGQSDNDGA